MSENLLAVDKSVMLDTVKRKNALVRIKGVLDSHQEDYSSQYVQKAFEAARMITAVKSNEEKLLGIWEDFVEIGMLESMKKVIFAKEEVKETLLKDVLWAFTNLLMD